MYFYLMDLERTIITSSSWYWRQNRNGYTRWISEAGLFTEEEAKEILQNDIQNLTIMVPDELINRIKEKDYNRRQLHKTNDFIYRKNG